MAQEEGEFPPLSPPFPEGGLSDEDMEKQGALIGSVGVCLLGPLSYKALPRVCRDPNQEVTAPAPSFPRSGNGDRVTRPVQV